MRRGGGGEEARIQDTHCFLRLRRTSSGRCTFDAMTVAPALEDKTSSRARPSGKLSLDSCIPLSSGAICPIRMLSFGESPEAEALVSSISADLMLSRTVRGETCVNGADFHAAGSYLER